MISATKSRPARRPVKAATRPAPSPPPLPFDWPLANEAEQFLRQRIALFLQRNTFARQLAARMRDETGTDLFEWTDHLVLAPSEEKALRAVGFVPDPQAETPNGETVYEHPRTTLPRVLLRQGNKQCPSHEPPLSRPAATLSPQSGERAGRGFNETLLQRRFEDADYYANHPVCPTAGS